MITELTDGELTALVAQNLREHLLKPLRTGLTEDKASDCRKRIIDLLNLSKPKSIEHRVL